MTEHVQFEDAERLRHEIGERLGNVLEESVGLQQELLDEAPLAAETGNGRDPSNTVEVRVAPGLVGVRVSPDWESRVGVGGLAPTIQAAYSDAQRSRFAVNVDTVSDRAEEEFDPGTVMRSEAESLGSDPEFRAAMQDAKFVERLHELFEQARARSARGFGGRGPRGLATVQLDSSGGMQSLSLDERRIAGMTGRVIADDVEAAYRAAVDEHNQTQNLNGPGSASRYVAVLSGRSEDPS
ncbi:MULTISPECIES: hypothetical protein [unclassified Leucobacter]|uniref:hypothetical protein n=1 Tax=unclassified Leucobacter TaxID=2621730 RepID=UPI000621F8D5|nr:hypothetical protein [Leucobacter sp. Ag1]KKI22601.1 hypothetical protein XM48_00930 [Leucobacter sp. Ag1]